MSILQDIALHSGGVDTCPFTDNFSLMTYNANGLSTDVTRGDREYQRHVLLLGAALKPSISVVGVQEPHGKLWDNYTSVHRTAEPTSFHFMGNLNPGGSGASAIYRCNVWEHISSLSLSPRLMFVYLRHNSGSKVFFMVGHLHHLPTLRKEQYAPCARKNARPTRLMDPAPTNFQTNTTPALKISLPHTCTTTNNYTGQLIHLGQIQIHTLHSQHSWHYWYRPNSKNRARDQICTRL